MTNEQHHREEINTVCFDMLNLCQTQLEKATQALLTNDSDLAEEVMHTENHVNALNIRIDRDCERFLALYNPVAIDLRFITSIKNINSELERIGDHAYGISKYVSKREKEIPKHLFEAVQFSDLCALIYEMLNYITEAYDTKNVKIARKVFKKDKKVNKIDDHVFINIEAEIIKDNGIIAEALLLSSVVKKLERVGDLIKNIAEDIIFYVDAEVIKHQKKK